MPVADIGRRTGHRFTAAEWGKLLDARHLEVLLFFALQPGKEFSRTGIRDSIWGPDSGVEDHAVDVKISHVNTVLRRHGAGIIVSHTTGRKGGGESSWWYTTTGAEGDRLVDASTIDDLVERVRPRRVSPRAEGLLMTTSGWWGWLKDDEFY